MRRNSIARLNHAQILNLGPFDRMNAHNVLPRCFTVESRQPYVHSSSHTNVVTGAANLIVEVPVTGGCLKKLRRR
jgi:hypothetical protein